MVYLLSLPFFLMLGISLSQSQPSGNTVVVASKTKFAVGECIKNIGDENIHYVIVAKNKESTRYKIAMVKNGKPVSIIRDEPESDWLEAQFQRTDCVWAPDMGDVTIHESNEDFYGEFKIFSKYMH